MAADLQVLQRILL